MFPHNSLRSVAEGPKHPIRARPRRASAPPQQFTADKARLNARRCFYELLVLQTKDVSLDHPAAYADTAIKPRPLPMAQDAS